MTILLLVASISASGLVFAEPALVQFNINRIYIYYDFRYPTGWNSGSDSWNGLSLSASAFLVDTLSNVFLNYTIPFEVVNATTLGNVCGDLKSANQSMVIMAMDVAPDTIWNGSADDSKVENWLEAGGIMIWTGAQEFYYIGHENQTRERVGGNENYVFDQQVTVPVIDLYSYDKLFAYPTSLGSTYLPSFNKLWPLEPTNSSWLSNLYYEAYGSLVFEGNEYFDPVLFQAGLDAQGYFVKVGTNDYAVRTASKAILELVLNRFFGLGATVSVLPKTPIFHFTPEGIEPYFTINLYVPSQDTSIHDPDWGHQFNINRQAWARMVGESLANIGIEAVGYNISVGERQEIWYVAPEFPSSVYQENGFDALFIGWGYGSYNDVGEIANSLWSLYHSTQAPYKNMWLWNSSDSDELLDAAVASSNVTEIEDLLVQWQALFYREQPCASLSFHFAGTPAFCVLNVLGFNMFHPVFGTGVETPLGTSNSSRALEAARYVRQAISHAIPRENIITTLDLNATSAVGAFHPTWPGYDDSLSPYEYNITRALELMALAGYDVDSLMVHVESPVTLLVTDPWGHRTGVDPETGLVVNEILGATYFGPETGTQGVLILNAIEDLYFIDLSGTSDGSFHLSTFQIKGSSVTSQSFTDNIAMGEAKSFLADTTGTDISTTSCVHAMADIDCNTLNLKSKGKWITAYIELPEGQSVAEIDISTILCGSVSADLNAPVDIGDHDGNNIPDLMVKFSRSAIQEIVSDGYNALIITGELNDGTAFADSDVLRVIISGKDHVNELDPASIEN